MEASPTELALKSLIDWWTESGVPPEGPLPGKSAITPKKSTPRVAPNHKPDTNRTKPPPRVLRVDPIAEAETAASRAKSIDDVIAALKTFEHCDLKQSARNAVICDGVQTSQVMLIGEAPGRDEDAAGLPFVGRSGKLLDRMFAVIGFARETNLFITNSIFWRPPANRAPSPEEIAICAPFVRRQIELLRPKLIITVGKTAAQSLLNTNAGIMRLRGRRTSYQHPGLQADIPCMPILHPAYLLRRPQDKALAWRDLLEIDAMCEELGVNRRCER